MNKSIKQIKLGAIISYLTLFINTIASLIYLPWMVSVIGKADYALYTLSTTFISIFMVDFGLSSAVSRFIAKYHAEGNNDKINIFISTVERLYILIDIVLLVGLCIVYIFLEEIYQGLSEYELATYRQLYLIVAIYGIVSFPFMPFSGILNAYEKFIQLKICELFQKIIAIFLTIVSLLAGGGIKCVVLATAISGILTTIVKYNIIKRTLAIKIDIKKNDKTIVKEIFEFSIWITIISLAQRCAFNLAPTILGIVSDSTQIAIFSPASTLESFFYSFSAAVNGLFLPTISRYLAEKNKEGIYVLMVKIGRYQLIVTGLIYIGFLCVGKEFMTIWMGKDFVLTWPCALIVFLPDIMIFSQQIADTTMIAKNKVKQQTWGYIGMAAVCITLSFLLCEDYGAIGSSLAIAISYLFLFIYMNFLYEKELGINIKDFFNDCYRSLGIPIVSVGIISFLVC